MVGLPAYTNGRRSLGFPQSVAYIREVFDEAAICVLADRTCRGLGGLPAGRNSPSNSDELEFHPRGDRVW